MDVQDLGARLAEQRDRIQTLLERLDIAGKAKAAAALEEQAAEPDLWADPEAAQRVMRDLTLLRQQVDTWQGMAQQSADLIGLLELAVAEDDPQMIADVAADAERLGRELGRVEFQVMLGGPYDARDALLAIHARAGGTESQDWTEMLLRMYLRWAERRGYKAEVLDLTPGEEAGIKSVTVGIAGSYAYGYLKAERGTHRLVRLSPFDAQHRRHTSFALIEVMPDVEDAPEVTINPEEIEIDVFRSSGAGGQNVQKTSTAVRITHLPTGLVVTCQNERSQVQNKETALKILRARLMEIEIEKREAEQAKLKGQHVPESWGTQIRSYVLHPYNLVKDHRTGYETSDTTRVLEGEIDDFVQAYLRSVAGQGAPS
ncbi:MAG: peptide chain release factor 2 [Chloroflexi bacterium]|nr:peptide chain release factor 2 [Chloroflexota bacterium]